MFTDFVLNGQAHGNAAEMLSGVRFDPGMLRPYLNRHGVPTVTINTGRMQFDEKLKRMVPQVQAVAIADLQRRGINSPVFNATTLRKDQWIEMDRVVVRQYRARLRAAADLAAANTYGGFNGMAKMTLEYEAQSDPGEAVVDMDGLVDARTDSPLFSLRSIPLPITHSDFWFSARRLAASRSGGTPLDTTMAEAAGRRVAESVERTTIGIDTGVQYGPTATSDTRYDNTSKIYGYTNLPQRITKTNLATPTGLNASTTISDVIAMRETMFSRNFFGPFVLYVTPSWDQWLDQDYILTGGNVATQTLRQRLEAIEGITAVRRLDFWAPAGRNNPALPYSATAGGTYQMLLIQMTQDVARMINGLDVTTVQWESQGGMRTNFKVMCIQVPQLRYDYNGIAAVLHATTF